MTSKKKAEELTNKFYFDCDNYELCKHYAFISVDEILKVLSKYGTKEYEYWEEVKQEIKKL